MTGTPRLYCVWRVDGELELTDLDPKYQGKSTNELVRRCITAPDTGFKEQEIEDLLRTALDTEASDFIGYEMPCIFVSSDVKFIQT